MSSSARRHNKRQSKKEAKERTPLIKEIPVKRPTRARAGSIKPLTDAQLRYDKAIFSSIITIGLGPAGTGKTWWATSRAAEQLRDGGIDKLIITRPAVEAGESLGFLPGELEEKYSPYVRPVRQALEETLGSGPVEYMMRSGQIEIAPLAFLRGMTFKNCWVILDEAQNTTPLQMKLFLTRIGENCKAIVNGDGTQQDIPGASGLKDAVERFADLRGVSVIGFGVEDVVRSGICQRIVERYAT